MDAIEDGIESRARFAVPGLWAITAYFNPLGYRTRLANYRIFRRHLDVPLLAVELGYGGDFDLGPADADILVQLRGGDVLWQKERLLNVALRNLPTQCDKIVWVDCDVIFGQGGWAFRIDALLKQYPMVQAFSRVHLMPRGWTPDRPAARPQITLPSVAALVAAGLPVTESMRGTHDGREGGNTPGFGWAAGRELLERHGFYDGGVVGGDDRTMASAAYGSFDEVMERHRMNDRQRDRYFAWGRPYYESVRGEVGVLEGELFHLWHGETVDRRSLTRFTELLPFNYDPFNDVALADSGAGRWDSDKKDLHRYVHDHFARRKEDG